MSGIVVDGAVRDVDQARELGLPILALAAVPVTARGRIAELATNEPITLAGIVVAPGDLVLADGSGVVVVAAADAARVIEAAEEIARREVLIADEIEAGRPVTEAMAGDYESMLKSERG